MNKNSKILITGAAGFLGANLTKFLYKDNKNLSILINKKSNLWRINDVVKSLDVHYLDIKNKNKVFEKIKKIKPDYVYHFATYGVYPSQNNFEEIIKTNILGTSNILHALEKYGIKRLVNIGSGFEYGQGKGRIKETDCVSPLTPYAITKVTQSLFVKYFSELRNVPSVTLRVFTPYGRLESKGRLISDIMLSIIRNKPIHLSSMYSYRDFVFIDDVIDALKKAANTPKIEDEIFNIGSGKATSIKKIVDTSIKLVKKKPQIEWNSNKPRSMDKFQTRSFSDLKKSEKLLKWKPSTSLEKGLENSYLWYKKNSNLY
jgi:nucleoside-diphosphate-sugar epimerase